MPIVIDKNNVVVKGHARLKAAKRLGMEEVPCIVSDASEEVIKADRIADNKIQELSSWDFAKRELELERICDAMTFGKLFHPEENKVAEEVFDVPTFEYKPTGLDFSGEDYSGDAPARHEHPPVDVYVDVPEYTPKNYVDMSTGEVIGEIPESAFQQIPEKRKFRTLCPYCGKVVTIDV